jgi:hypothetical protein
MAVLVTAIHVFPDVRKDVDARNKSGHDDGLECTPLQSSYPSTVLPFLITVALRDFTLASNEITLPSFHRSMVTVSPG